MLSLFRTLSFRYLKSHWARSGLVVLSIALGVATWVATDALQRALDKSLRQAATPLAGADAYVTNGAVDGVAVELAAKLRQMQGVAHVEPVVLEPAIVARTETDLAGEGKEGANRDRKGVGRGRRGVLLVGLSSPERSAERKRLEDRGIEVIDFDVRKAFLAEKVFGAVPVLVGQQLDEDFLQGKETLVIQARGKVHHLWRVGQVRATGPAATLGGHVVIARWQDAARMLGHPGLVNRLDVTLAPGVDRAETLGRLKRSLADRAKVQSNDERAQRLDDLKRELCTAFKLCGAGALVVGLFLVYNALSVSVSERRHDIGILRSVGATRSQVRMLFLAEALMMGVVGSGVGLPLGLGMAHLALGPVQKALHGIYLPLEGKELEPSFGLLLSAAVAGLATSLLAALVPASRAAAEEPAEAVRRAPPAVSVAYRLLQVASSLALIGVGLFLSFFRGSLTPDMVFRVCLGLLATGVAVLVTLGLSGQGSGTRGQPEEDPSLSLDTLSDARYRIGSDAASFSLHPTLIPVAVVIGLVLTTGGGLGLLLRDTLTSAGVLYLAPGLLFLGALLAVPLLAAVVNRGLVQPLARVLLPLPSRLAADNLVRSPGRTGLVVAALTAVVALTVHTAGVIRSNEDAFLAWVDATVKADLYISAGGPVSSTGDTRLLADTVADDLRRELPAGSRLVGLRFRYVEWDPSAEGMRNEGSPPGHTGGPKEATGTPQPSSLNPHPSHGATTIYMILIDAAAYVRANSPLAEPDPNLETWKALLAAPDGVLVSENFARIHGVRSGDTIRLKGKRGPLPLRVVGTLTDYNWIRGTIFLDRQRHRDDLEGGVVSAWEVYLPAGVRARAEEAREKLQKSAVGSRLALVTLTQREISQGWRDVIRRLYSVPYTQELLVGIVAVLGVMMSLLISVLGRQRELGLLRAVGGTRSQVLHTVLAEAVLIGVVGTFLGLLIGLPLEWYIVRVLLFEETGFLFPVRIPWTEAGVITLLSVLAATLAGLGPALHAMRLRITDAIAYE
jgi:ABC-type lipoprotein release transport system permease subunit